MKQLALVEVRHYKEVNLSLNTRLDFVSERLSLLDREKSQLEIQLQEKDTEISKQRELHSANQTRLNATVEAWRAKADAFSNTIEINELSSKEVIGSLREELARAQQDIVDKSGHIEELSHEISALKDGLTQTKSKLAAESQACASIEQQRKQAQDLHQAANAELREVWLIYSYVIDIPHDKCIRIEGARGL